MEVKDDHLIEVEHEGLDKAEYRRLAGRTYKQFEKDIKKGHRNEREAIERYAKFYKTKTGKELSIIDNGIDNSGGYLDIKDVKDDADFIINGKLVEVKIIKNKLFKFRLKLNLIKSYIKQNANMMIVIGWETDSPEFTIVNKEKLERMAKYSKKNVSGDWEGKPTVTVYKNSFNWNYLPF
jgi:hypothetical protein